MICTVITSFWSDRAQTRSPFILAGFSVTAIGYIAQLVIPEPRLPGLTYAFMFVVAAGFFSPFLCIVCWIGNNLAPSSKRAVGMALCICLGALGGIVGSNVFLAREAPHYTTGYGACLGFSLAAILMTVIIRIAIQRENVRRERRIDDEGEDSIRAQYTEQQLMDMGDKSPFFRYTL